MLDRVPNQSFIYSFILMPIDVPGGGDRRPVDLWMPVEQIIREPPRSFRDDLQCANYGVNRLSVGAKSFEVEFRVYQTIARLAGLRRAALVTIEGV